MIKNLAIAALFSLTAVASAATIPAGTEIVVRLIDSIEAQNTAIGEKFRCSIDDPLIEGDYVVVRRGSECTVQVLNVATASRMKGREQLAIKLFDVTVKEKTYDVASDEAQLQGKKQGTVKKTAGGAGIGALLGGIIGGGSGAAIGALAGAGGGLVLSGTSKNKLNVPAETRLTFRLTQDLPLD